MSVGTPRSSGSCTLTFYGVNAPAPLNTSPVGSGEVFTVTLMNIAPNFQGYRERQKVGGEYRNPMILHNNAQRTPRYDHPISWRLGDLAALDPQGRR